MSNWWVKRYVSQRDLVSSDLTIAVKDLFDIQGEVTGAGSKVVSSWNKMADTDATVVANAKAAGAVVVGKSITTELAYAAQGVNPFFGTPTNPLYPDLIPGGSSSGSAVAVAVGDVVVGLGSDTGGSIRIPACCCGIYGLKTSAGRISLDGVWPLSQTLDTVGPLAKSVEDLAVGLRAMEASTFDITQQEPFSTVLRVKTSSSNRIEAALDACLSVYGGFQIVDYDFQEHLNLSEAGIEVMGFEAYQNDSMILKDAHRMDPWVRNRLEESSLISEVRYRDALRYLNEQRKRFASLLFDLDAVLVLASVPFPVPSRRNAYSQRLNVNTLPFNVLGLPALSFPLSTAFVSSEVGSIEESLNRGDEGQGVSQSGVEVAISVQVVGPPNSEERLLRTVQMIESRIS